MKTLFKGKAEKIKRENYDNMIMMRQQKIIILKAKLSVCEITAESNFIKSHQI